PPAPCYADLSHNIAFDTTDSRGRAEARVELGTVAGTGQVYVTVAALALRDSFPVTVRPGAPAALRAGVRDSTAFVGGSYAIRAATYDRYGNPTPPRNPITHTGFGSAATVDAGGVFRAEQIGRAGAVLRSGALADTAWITVPPRGVIAALQGGYGNESLVKVELDGSGLRPLHRLGYAGYYGSWPDWSRTGEIVLETGGYSSERLLVVDTLGNSRRVTAEGSPTSGEIFGAFMPDGAVLFSANGGSFYGTSIWRVAAPGQLPVRVGPTPHGNANNWKVSPAPDGERVVYMSVDRGMSVMNLRDGSTTTLRSTGDMPRWSPRGDWIVFNMGSSLQLIRPDGTGLRAVGTGHPNGAGPDWSPDGEWLIAGAEGGRLELIRVATGETLPLAWSQRFSAPAWKP
ncbi:MAG TPA: hypothetical protein VF625_09770, partial [Longimicrobium sp.]